MGTVLALTIAAATPDITRGAPRLLFTALGVVEGERLGGDRSLNASRASDRSLMAQALSLGDRGGRNLEDGYTSRVSGRVNKQQAY